jgi:HK97 family phage portal protein
MLRTIRKIFTGGRTKALQPVGHTGDPWGSLSTGYVATSPVAAENLSGIASCVSLISGTISNLPAAVWLRQNDQRIPAPTQPLSRIVRDGSGNMTWPELLECWIADCLLTGNGLMQIQTDGSGRLSGLRWLPWARISWQAAPNASVVYNFTDYDGTRRTFLPEEVLHLRDRLSVNNPNIGISRIARSPGVVALANVLHASTQSYAGNVARPGGVLASASKVSPELAARLKEDWDTNFSNAKKGKTAVLGEGLEWKPVSGPDAESAQLVEQLTFSLQECARIFNIPPQCIGDISQSTYSNSSQASRALAVFCLAQWVSKIEAVFRKSVLTAPYSFSIDLSELLRGDVQAYTQSLTLLRNSAVLSANEVRLQLGFDRNTQEGSDDLEAVQHSSSASGGSTGDTGDQPATGKKIALVK